MHLGNARTALLAWMDARSRGGRMLLRVEDLDRVRCKPQFAEGVRRDLAWLGLDWDEETAPQSARDDAYAEAVDRLAEQGAVFACSCTRRELALASAPHDPAEAGRRCVAGCRSDPRPGRRAAIRVELPDAQVTVDDRLTGRLAENPGRAVGDMVVRRSDGLYAYQLAVVVDDAADGVTDIVRGADLRSSTPRQVALQGLLGLPTPRYAHVPLMLGADGAWVGTRLVATDESLAHEEYKARLVSAAATDTVRTSVFGPEMPEFNPMRVLRNRAIDEPHTDERPIIGRTRLGDEVIDLPRYTNMVPMRGLTTGDMDEMPLLSGQGVGLVDAVKGAESVIADMTAQAVECLARYRR